MLPNCRPSIIFWASWPESAPLYTPGAAAAELLTQLRLLSRRCSIAAALLAASSNLLRRNFAQLVTGDELADLSENCTQIRVLPRARLPRPLRT